MFFNNTFKLVQTKIQLFHLNQYKCLSGCKPKMDKAYLRHSPSGEHFDLTVELTEGNVKRPFNFSRKLSETIETFLSRVTTNINKVLNKKSKKKNNSSEMKTVSASLIQDNTLVASNQLCEEVFRPGNSVFLTINDKTYPIIINSPWVSALDLPTSIMASFPTYPSKFEFLYTTPEQSEFVWYSSKNGKNWVEVNRGFTYTPSNEDIQCFLKFSCTPKNDQLVGPTVDVVSSCKVEASPGECPFERRHVFTRKKLQGSEFRVVSYNILADLYCDSDFTREHLFPYCPPYALSIDYRKQLFLKEIIGYNADIMCLQEVDRKVFKYDLEPVLSHLGYGGVLYTKGNDVAEGLAFFYAKNRFILLDSVKFIMAEHIDKDPLFADIWERIQQNTKLAERILARTTTLQVNVVGSLELNSVLVVANIHLYFHPDSDHIRLLHGCIAIRYLEDFVKKIKERYEGKQVSLVFCGDFNSVPECGIYKLFTTGSVSGNFVDYSSNTEEAIENIDMTQSFKLESACGTPEFTNFTAGFAACLDYIYYDTANLTVSQVVPLPSTEELNRNTAIPSVVFPSDHIALISDLKWL